MCLGTFRSFSLAIEQPKSTWMFGLPQMIELFTQRKMQKYLTYLGHFVTRHNSKAFQESLPHVTFAYLLSTFGFFWNRYFKFWSTIWSFETKGCPIAKPTWIMTDLAADSLRVRMSEETKARCKRNAEKYYKKEVVEGRVRVSGKKALSLTAKWPKLFCLALYRIWLQHSDQVH